MQPFLPCSEVCCCLKGLPIPVVRYQKGDWKEDHSRLIQTPIGNDLEYATVHKVPGEARFAAAVAAFGQLLRQAPYLKDFTYDDIIDLAAGARGKDLFGYRSQFVNLVRLAKTARAMGQR